MRISQGALAVAVCSAFFAVQAAGQQPQTATPAQAPAPAGPVNPDPWPKTAMLGGAKYTMYQPQLDSWDQIDLSAHAAVSVLPAGAKNPVFGVVEMTAQTYVSRKARTVSFQNLKVEKVAFPVGSRRCPPVSDRDTADPLGVPRRPCPSISSRPTSRS